MTLIICAKVFDGIVLVADSKNLLMKDGEALHGYYGIQKIFSLSPNLPIGIATLGRNFVGIYSIPVIIKRFQKELLSSDEKPRAYSVQQVSEKLKEFVYKIYQSSNSYNVENNSPLVFIVAGYNHFQETSVICGFEIDEHGNKPQSTTYIDNQLSGLMYLGANEYLSRLIEGYSPQMKKVINNKSFEGIEFIQNFKNALVSLEAEIIHPLTPLNKVQEICEFLMDVAIKFETYTTGTSIIGAPVMIATITKGDGFQWKQYFN